MRDEVEAVCIPTRFLKVLKTPTDDPVLLEAYTVLLREYERMATQFDFAGRHNTSLEWRLLEATEEAHMWQDAWSHLYDLHRKTLPELVKTVEEEELDQMDQEDAPHLTKVMQKLNKLVVPSLIDPEEEVL